MPMSTFEIVQMYKEAADKNAQIEILADMNLCSKEDILLVLQNEGLISGVKATKKATSKAGKRHKAEKMTWNDEAKEQVRKLLAEGLTVLEAAERMGLDFMQVRNAVTRYKLREGGKCERNNSANMFVPCDSRGICQRGKSVPGPAEKVDALSVVSLIRDYAKCITALSSADIRNYEKIVRTFAESIIEGADGILREGEKYGA